MRKLLILLILALVSLTATAGRPASRARLNAIVSEFRHYDGVESFHLGRLATAAAKSFVRHADASDADTREAIALLDGVKDFTILDFSDCDDRLRDRIARRIDRALDGCELLMEMRDGDSGLQLYGALDERNGKVRDIVLYNAEDCALICIAGKVSMDAIGRILADD